MAHTTPATAPATTLPWAWRLFRAPDSDERFLIAFLHAQSQGPSNQDWSCDEVARTEDEARAYALLYGVSPDSFTNALEYLRARLAAGNANPAPIRAVRFAMSPSTRALGLRVRSNVSRLTLTSPNLGR